MAIQFVRADIIMPGEHGVSINNKIDNMKDFQDYYLILYAGSGGGPCKALIIIEDGVVPKFYKLCRMDIYAVKKSELLLNVGNTEGGPFINETNRFILESFFNSSKAIKLAENIQSYQTLPDANPITEINNHYTLEIGKIKKSPDSGDVTRNPITYAYIALSLIGLLAIIFILYRRNRNVS